jgi:putative sigma-54 modulation protein
MRIEVKARNVPVTDELRECVTRRFEKVSRQVADVALLEVELWEDPRAAGNPCIAEATLHLKGTSLRAKEGSRDFKHAVNLVGDDVSRQVKRHRDKRRNRRVARAATPPGSLPAT